MRQHRPNAWHQELLEERLHLFRRVHHLMLKPPVHEAEECSGHVVGNDLARHRKVVGGRDDGKLLHRLATQVAVHRLVMRVDRQATEQGRLERLGLLDMPKNPAPGTS